MKTLEPTKELWAIVDEHNNIMASCKFDYWTKSKIVKRDPLVYTSEKNACNGLRQYTHLLPNLKVKKIQYGLV